MRLAYRVIARTGSDSMETEERDYTARPDAESGFYATVNSIAINQHLSIVSVGEDRVNFEGGPYVILFETVVR